MIELINGYFADADENQYILKKAVTGMRKDDSGERKPTIIYNAISYHSTLESAVRACVRDCLRNGVMNGEITTFTDFLETLEEDKKKLHELLEVE